MAGGRMMKTILVSFTILVAARNVNWGQPLKIDESIFQMAKTSIFKG
jgi:hypothetical protein